MACPPESAGAGVRHLSGGGDAPCWRFVIEERGRPGGRNPVLPPLPERTLVGGDRHSHRRAGDRNRGLGTEAVRTLLQHLFEVKGVNRVTIGPEPPIDAPFAPTRKPVFSWMGSFAAATKWTNRWVDAVHMTILDDEWPAAKARWEADQSKIG